MPIPIFSDASLTGWGAICDCSLSRGPWTTADAERHINELELLAAYLSLQAFANSSKNISIQLFLDNSTAVAYINKCGGTHSKALSILAAQIIHWRGIEDGARLERLDAATGQFQTPIKNLAGSDRPLCVGLECSAFQRRELATAAQGFGDQRIRVELAGVDRLRLSPIRSYPTLLGKIKKEKADIVLVGPLWLSQPWFPLLLQMSIDLPRILSSHHLLLHSPMLEPHPLIRSKKFLLVAWKLSGDVLKIKDFQKELSTFSWKVSVSPHQLVTSPPGKIGLIGTTNRVRIPCLLLW